MIFLSWIIVWFSANNIIERRKTGAIVKTMNKEQYLEARINDINETLRSLYLPPKYRKNQMHALMMCKLDLEREKAYKHAEHRNSYY